MIVGNIEWKPYNSHQPHNHRDHDNPRRHGHNHVHNHDHNHEHNHDDDQATEFAFEKCKQTKQTSDRGGMDMWDSSSQVTDGNDHSVIKY